MSKRTRRQFIEDSMFASAAAAAAAWQASSANQVFAQGADTPKGANEKLSVCCIGVGGRGSAHVDAYTKRDDCEITWIVDIDSKIGNKTAEEIGKKQGRVPKVAADMREAFDDKSLDLVSIATPNHWHALSAIWAMQAGKDVYVEKPVSHNVSEGRRIVEVARKYNKICQTGTQSRSHTAMRDGMKFIHEGGIGKVTQARGLCYKNRPSIGPKGEYDVPKGVNYDLWLGPAPLAPLTRPKFHYDWHWQWPYGNGDLGNQGIHQMDLARWGLNVNELAKNVWSFGGRIGYEDAGETANTQLCFFDYGDKSLVFEVRGLPTKTYRDAKVGIIVYGDEGSAVVTNYAHMSFFDNNGKELPTRFKGGGDAFGNFIDAVRSRNYGDLNADILEGHLSSALCHLGNISYRHSTEDVSAADLSKLTEKAPAAAFTHNVIERIQEHVTGNKLDPAATKFHVGPMLAFDPAKEKFMNNPSADAMLTREYRAPFVVPTKDKI
jgi:predicted dehydrogenase